MPQQPLSKGEKVIKMLEIKRQYSNNIGWYLQEDILVPPRQLGQLQPPRRSCSQSLWRGFHLSLNFQGLDTASFHHSWFKLMIFRGARTSRKSLVWLCDWLIAAVFAYLSCFRLIFTRFMCYFLRQKLLSAGRCTLAKNVVSLPNSGR